MKPRHSVMVQKRKKVTGSAGQKELVNDGAPLRVRGNVHPLSAEEIRFYGDLAVETRKFFCTSWPADMFCVITYNGATWDQVSPQETFDLGQRTQHAEVVIRKRGSNGGGS